MKGIVKSIFICVCILIRVNHLSAQHAHCYTNEKLIELSKTDPAAYQNIMQSKGKLSNTFPIAKTNEDIYTIPVVVHVVYHDASENISDETINEQIVVLNQDFMRLNEDTVNTPDIFQGIAANCNIQFCLASFDPDGDTTTGITRTFTTVETWPLSISDQIKSSKTGGADPWPANSYLNIWICNLQEGVLGYATMPQDGIQPPNDGLVIGYRFFGLGDISSAPYNLGRTATHEVGHWLGLFHVWGDDAGSCDQDDGIDDTPLQQDHTYDCPNFPLIDECTPEAPGVMFQNYMDYSDDNCMNLFTNNQKLVMRTTLETKRGSILNSPAGCNEIQPLPGEIAELILYPNPTSGYFTVAINNFKGTSDIMVVKVFDALGQLISEQHPEPSFYVSAYFDLSHYTSGCYFVQAFNGTYFLNKQVVIL